MRKRISIISLILVAATLTTLLMKQKSTGPAGGKNEIAESVPALPNVAVSSSKPPNQLQGIFQSPNNQMQVSIVNDRERTNENRESMESRNVPIKFYGKLVDQNENPLAASEVNATVRHWIVIAPVPFGDQDQAIQIKKITDTDGRFEISGVAGDGISVRSIKKDGYEAEPWPASFGPINASYDNPIIFKMWNTNIHEALTIGEKEFEIHPDGKPHFIDLTKGTISETDNGDVKVWIQYTNQVTRGQIYDWSAGIEVMGGGLLEVPHGSVMFSAPKDGYVSTFNLHQQIKGGQSGEIGDRSFYLLLKDGKVYGRMIINLFAPYGRLHPGLIRLSYAINPSGSRILR